MSIPTAFEGEVQFAGYADSSRSGPRITLRLADRDDLQRFIGLEGRRFMAALVLLDDAEQPVEPPKVVAATKASDEPEKPKGGPLARLAGQWCAMPEFWDWIGQHRGAYVSSKEEAADWLRRECGVESRAELDFYGDAQNTFHATVRGPFSKYLIAKGVTR